MKIVIVGAGGLAKTTLEWLNDVIETNKSYEFVGFLDGNQELWGTSLMGHAVLGGLDWLEANKEVGCIVAIGQPASREKVVGKVQRFGNPMPTIIHPRATVSDSAKIGEGCVLCPNVTVGAEATVGRFVFANIGCVIGHDSIVEDYCHIGPGVYLSGHSTVGVRTDLGTTSALIQNVSVGSDCIIGAGAMVTRDVPANSVAVGVPAKVIKSR